MPACDWCDERIDGEYREIPHLGETGPAQMKQYHPECAIRMIIGGLNHLKRTCPCYGGTDEPDPPGMTSHEAAEAAATYWQRNHL